MATRSTIRFSYEGIGALLRSDMLKEHLATRAERVVAIARDRAPVYKGPDDPHRGRYKDSFSVETTNRGGYKKDRAAALVVNDAPEAIDVEKGSSRQRGQHIMINALIEGASD